MRCEIVVSSKPIEGGWPIGINMYAVPPKIEEPESKLYKVYKRLCGQTLSLSEEK